MTLAMILCLGLVVTDATPTLKTGIVLPVPRLDKPNPFGWSTEVPTIVYERKFRPHPDTKWLGFPVTAQRCTRWCGDYAGEAPDELFTHRDYEIGLDPSGIVVWRKKP